MYPYWAPDNRSNFCLIYNRKLNNATNVSFHIYVDTRRTALNKLYTIVIICRLQTDVTGRYRTCDLVYHRRTCNHHRGTQAVGRMVNYVHNRLFQFCINIWLVVDNTYTSMAAAAASQKARFVQTQIYSRIPQIQIPTVQRLTISAVVGLQLAMKYEVVDVLEAKCAEMH